MKKKIFFIFSNFDQRQYTGQAGTIWELILHLSTRFQCYVLSNGQICSEQPPNGISMLLFPSGFFPTLKFIIRFPIVIFHVIRLRPDIIHVHGLPLILYVRVLAFVTNSPFSCSFNEDITLRPLWMQKSIAQCINKSDHTFVSCHYFSTHLKNLGVNPKKVSVSLFGLRPEFFMEPTSVKGESYDVGYIGDARKSRGFDIACQLAKYFPDRSFLFLIRWVSESGQDDLDEVQKLQNVTLLYYPYKTKLTDLLDRMKIIVLPFRSTSAILPPMTIVECMALGKCIVTSNLPGTSDLIGNDTPLHLIDPNNLSAVQDTMIHLFNNPQLIAETGKNAKQKIKIMLNNQYTLFDTFFLGVSNKFT